MKTFAEVQTPGGPVRFDADPVEGAGPEKIGRRDGALVSKLDQSLDEALVSVRPAAEAVVNTFRTLSPDATQVEFGLRIDAQAGAVLARAGIGTHFIVTLNWSQKSRQACGAITAPAVDASSTP